MSLKGGQAGQSLLSDTEKAVLEEEDNVVTAEVPKKPDGKEPSEEEKRLTLEVNTQEATKMMLRNQKFGPFIRITRCAFEAVNFGVSALSALILCVNAFTMEGIEGLQVFHTDRVLQSFQNQPPAFLNQFVKSECGSNTEILGVASSIESMPGFLPHMFEVTGSNSMLRLEAVHPNFMLFSALWVSSAFALSMFQFPTSPGLLWSRGRVLVVHVWNFVGLILTVVIFTGTTKWKAIPTSNLFYSLVGQGMAWAYQYFHMVECTQSVEANKLSLQYAKHVSAVDFHNNVRPLVQYSTELRKLIYMELSVIAPMMLVAGIMPGVIGVDEWRIQTVLFASWTLYALLGLQIRFRDALKHNASDTQTSGAETVASSDEKLTDHGYDALGYLTYAIVLVFAMLVNAMGRTTFAEPPYITESIKTTRQSGRVLLILSSVVVFEAVATAVIMRWNARTKQGKRLKHLVLLKSIADEQNNTEVDVDDVDAQLIPWFFFNVVVIGAGVVLVKVLLFFGLTNVNALSISPAP
jgi:hypothetical protein